MKNNEVIRRQGYSASNGYQKLTEDFTELFTGFEGVSIEKTEASEDGTVTDQVKIFLDKNKKMYLLIVPSSDTIVRVSFHLGNGTKENESWIYVDQRANKADKLSYNFVRTPYGAAFSTLVNSTANNVSLSDGYLQSYFTTFETNDGRTVNGFIYCVLPKEETSNYNPTSYIATEEHDILEGVELAKCFLGNTANQTVLVNASSYTKPMVCNHLYKKVQSEDNKYGLVELNNRKFISGSHYCLECGEEE